MVLYFQNKFFPNVKSGNNFETEYTFNHKNGVAFDNEQAFFASGLNEGGYIHFAPIPNVSFQNLKSWVAQSFGDANPIEVKNIPGKCYKRMWRPLVCTGSLTQTVSQEKRNESFIALRILLNRLEDIFETVEPTESNSSVYGHKIREILLLACMEVESSWSAVLRENNYVTTKRNLDTTDYIKLNKPMLLDGYELKLRAYPNFRTFTPFKDWDANKPTQSLDWYDAYNQTKHNREENLKLSTLDNAIKAVGAAVVMYHAQFGFRSGLTENSDQEIRNFFNIITVGFEKYEKDYYIPKIDLNLTLKKATPVGDWEQIDYPF
jgi:hypothetical protein